MKLSVNAEINSPKRAVWEAITDIEKCQNFISGIIDLTIIEQPENSIIGLKWSETREMFGKECTEVMWITHAKEYEYYHTRSENHGTIYLTKFSLIEINGKTLLTMTFSSTSQSIFIKIISSIMGLFVKKAMIRMLQQDMDDIKSHVESQTIK